MKDIEIDIGMRYNEQNMNIRRRFIMDLLKKLKTKKQQNFLKNQQQLLKM